MAKNRSQKKAGRLAFETNIFDSLVDPIVLIDEFCRVVDANVSAEELLGLDGKGSELAAYLNASEVLTDVRKVLRSGRSQIGQFTLPPPIGRIFEYRATPLVPRAPRKSPWAILVLHDVTEANKTQQMREDFVVNVSHELRSPLSSLIGLLETLSGPARNDAAVWDRFLTIMTEEANRMKRLVNDLLVLSKVEAEEHIPPTDSVDPVAIVEQAAEVLNLGATDGEDRIKVDVRGAFEPLVGSSDLLLQVFLNLLSNALAYGDSDGAVEAKIRRQKREDQGGKTWVSITVTNRGDGIPAEHIPRLTERFYRVDKARSRQAGGTGLGLAITKHIVGRHRGRLLIESSREERKTTVTVLLPDEKPSIKKETPDQRKQNGRRESV
ncbi:MAG: ATP-binding protein [Magnetospiraceae bacterium]